ncbi:hypothetical protein AB8G41_27030, partial [Salmonella enterica]
DNVIFPAQLKLCGHIPFAVTYPMSFSLNRGDMVQLAGKTALFLVNFKALAIISKSLPPG